ncbi:uncharacterized protein K452DRAFT_287552 [Aplosporella prunicola CBS 121167]|uniref:Wax synthase domain-containing protein n=1 Tax=Aplosporella prunicola CBS 121167 TaxID=1176127 RepID=A0A6A6BBV4_9PEZI|nr:uncharacterized protein K452DRAFT_287552 [Aplosporella prunicola CBS 121167]KAF2141600.1 hypothetical protein K452DRAFT_287552 [Aplosporella prunicola CBS 121167]
MVLRFTQSGSTSLWDLDVIRRSLAVISWAASTITLMDIGYHVLCVVGTATGLFWNRIETLHPLMGHWANCYTLGRFWGRTWHQNFRRALQMPGQYLARDVLRASKGSLLSRHIQSYTAFLLSGLYHYGAAKMTVPTAGFYGTCVFFAVQPNALLLEDYVLHFAKSRFGCKSQNWHILGYLWTFSVLTYSATGFIDESIWYNLVRAFPVFSSSVTSLFLDLLV